MLLYISHVVYFTKMVHVKCINTLFHDMHNYSLEPNFVLQ